MGIPVDMLTTECVMAGMETAIHEKTHGFTLCFSNVNSIVEAQRNPQFQQALRNATISVPDGMPLVWLGRLKEYPIRRRVYGPELMLGFCAVAEKKEYRHFFYGGSPGTPEKLKEVLLRKFPNLQVVGAYSPPFRSLTAEEDEQIVEMINRAAPDVVWVGLGAPKQEIWMQEHRTRLQVPVLAGVGAAFDFFTGRVKQAPPWMRDHGLEWLYRLLQEPGRLWRRYLIGNAKFLYYLLLEQTGLKRFES
jgi:N-acetylglucosaminyldiphosphoundecaprenol N-acetyl-beta-D-mannosaminyltransferase